MKVFAGPNCRPGTRLNHTTKAKMGLVKKVLFPFPIRSSPTHLEQHHRLVLHGGGKQLAIGAGGEGVANGWPGGIRAHDTGSCRGGPGTTLHAMARAWRGARLAEHSVHQAHVPPMRAHSAPERQRIDGCVLSPPAQHQLRHGQLLGGLGGGGGGDGRLHEDSDLGGNYREYVRDGSGWGSEVRAGAARGGSMNAVAWGVGYSKGPGA